MPKYSNVKKRIEDNKNSGNFIPIIPEGQESAIHTVRFITASIEESNNKNNNNMQAVLKCKIIKRGHELNNKEENLYFVLNNSNCHWQATNFLELMDALGLDWDRTDESDDLMETDWQPFFDELDDYSGNIDFDVEFKYQYDAKGVKKKGLNKYVQLETVKRVWPEKADEKAEKVEDEKEYDDTP